MTGDILMFSHLKNKHGGHVTHEGNGIGKVGREGNIGTSSKS